VSGRRKKLPEWHAHTQGTVPLHSCTLGLIGTQAGTTVMPLTTQVQIPGTDPTKWWQDCKPLFHMA
jgi:hypothetical protein